MVVDSYFYNVLCVENDASEESIRRAYYKLAIKYHPDKTSGLSETLRRDYANKFREINNAYQVLSDAEKRRKYDLKGRNDFENSPMLDPKEVFRQIFGGSKFDEFIGELSFVHFFEETELGAHMTDNVNLMHQDMHSSEQNEIIIAKRKLRVSFLAAKLIDRLMPFVEGEMDRTEFRKSCTSLAIYLKNESFGSELLKAIGYIYNIKAKQILGRRSFLGIASLYNSIKEKGHIIGQVYKTLSAAKNVSKNQSAKDGGGLDDDDVKNLLWQMACTDIEIILSEVCDIVLRTHLNTDKFATALKIMGEEFIK